MGKALPLLPPDPPDIPSPIKTSSQGIAGKVPGAYRPAITITHDELSEMKKNLLEWRKDPAALVTWMQNQGLVHLQILNHMATQEVLGRSGPQTKTAAIREFNKLSNEIIEAMQTNGALKPEPEAA